MSNPEPFIYRQTTIPLTLRPRWGSEEAAWWRMGVDAVLECVGELIVDMIEDM